MSALIDLTQPFYDGMPGFSFTLPSGREINCTASVTEPVSHADTAPFYDGKCAFAYTEARFSTSIGTRLDSPYIRYPEGRDIAALTLEEVVLPGLSLDVRGKAPEHELTPDQVDLPKDMAGKAVLFNFGWDEKWGKEGYLDCPFPSPELIDLMIERGVKLVGVDTVSVDGRRYPERPSHSRLLKNETLIVEDLTGLERLHGRAFRFFAVPLPVQKAASMPVRAFAELRDGGAT